LQGSRGLLELSNWKSTEFRQFLLYTGIVALKDSIFDDQYYLFLLLHCAYRLLCSQKQRGNNIENAQEILNLFVENFPIVFGAKSVTYNVHGLLHVRDTINQVGNLVSGSFNSFENYLQLLKKCVKKKFHILEQIFRKMVEEKYVAPAEEQIKLVGRNLKMNDCTLSDRQPDNFCFVGDEVPIQIESFEEVDGEIFINGRELQDRDSFFIEPMNSSGLGIYLLNL